MWTSSTSRTSRSRRPFARSPGRSRPARGRASGTAWARSSRRSTSRWPACRRRKRRGACGPKTRRYGPKTPPPARRSSTAWAGSTWPTRWRATCPGCARWRARPAPTRMSCSWEWAAPRSAPTCSATPSATCAGIRLCTCWTPQTRGPSSACAPGSTRPTRSSSWPANQGPRRRRSRTTPTSGKPWRRRESSSLAATSRPSPIRAPRWRSRPGPTAFAGCSATHPTSAVATARSPTLGWCRAPSRVSTWVSCWIVPPRWRTPAMRACRPKRIRVSG